MVQFERDYLPIDPMDRVRNFMRKETAPDPEQGGIMNEVNEIMTLSWGTRLKCFGACMLLGLLLSVLGTILWWTGNLKGFGVLFSFGSLVSLASTCFLMGPVNQVKKMFALTRLIPTCVVFLMIVLTLVVAFTMPKGGVLVILFVVIQYLALAWYSISYIPFARDAVSKVACACLD